MEGSFKQKEGLRWSERALCQIERVLLRPRLRPFKPTQETVGPKKGPIRSKEGPSKLMKHNVLSGQQVALPIREGLCQLDRALISSKGPTRTDKGPPSAFSGQWRAVLGRKRDFVGQKGPFVALKGPFYGPYRDIPSQHRNLFSWTKKGTLRSKEGPF